jgi:hypothetical protein
VLGLDVRPRAIAQVFVEVATIGKHALRVDLKRRQGVLRHESPNRRSDVGELVGRLESELKQQPAEA